MSNTLISRVETITPVLAEEYLKHNTNNRQLRKNIVSYYAIQMRNNQWMLNGEGIIFNEQGQLVDGQHRLAAIVESGVNVDILVVRNADKDSFATIDSGITRKISDTFFVKGIPNANVVASVISRYFRLCKHETMMTGGISNKTSTNSKRLGVSRQELLAEYGKNEDFWQDVVRFSCCVYSVLQIMPKSEIGALAAYLIKEKKHDQQMVYGFFEDALASLTPSKKMLAAYRNRLTKDQKAVAKMSAVYKQQLFTKVWNAYVDGREFTLMRWNEEQEGKKELK